MTFVDTHSHIYARQFHEDLDEALERCRKNGVEKIYMPNIDSNSIEAMMAVEARDPDRYVATMGVHPCYVKEDFEQELEIAENWLSKRDFPAIGEIGIDLYWDKSFFDQQKEAFIIQCGWAKEKGIPIIIHARESLDEIFEELDKIMDESLKGVFHCFSGNLDQAKRALDYGFYLGIGGVVTFKNGGLDKVLPQIGIEKLVLETDSPYLAPVPHRGKRNESSYIPIIAERVAELTGFAIEEVARTTTSNAGLLFGEKP